MVDNAPIGSVVVMLGTADRGPVLEPVEVVSRTHAASVFGYGGTLYNSYCMAYAVNPNATYCLMRINGRYARRMLTLTDEYGNQCFFEIKSREAGKAGNNIALTVELDKLMIIRSNGDEDEVINSYTLGDYETLGELVEAINSDDVPIFVTVTAPDFEPGDLVRAIEEFEAITSVEEEEGRVYLAGGDDGLEFTKNELYAMLEDAYHVLEGRRTDIIVLLDARFNDVTPALFIDEEDGDQSYLIWYSDDPDFLDMNINGKAVTFHGQLIDFCRRQAAAGIPTIGVIGVRPIPDSIPTLNAEHIASFIKYSCLNNRLGFVIDGSDFGHYVSIVFGDLEFDGMFMSGAPAYAALLAASGVETTTNKPLQNITGQSVQLDDEALKWASAAGLVVFYNSIKNGLSVYNGVTAAPYERPLRYIANVRIGHYVISRLRNALDAFVGTTGGIIPIRDMIARTAEEIMKTIQNEGVVSSYSLNIREYYYDAFSFGCQIDVTFRAKYAVEDMSATVMVNV